MQLLECLEGLVCPLLIELNRVLFLRIQSAEDGSLDDFDLLNCEEKRFKVTSWLNHVKLFVAGQVRQLAKLSLRLWLKC